ncbi:gamma-secretase subunit APH-1A [Paragonimus westermani]|uniref:Gamma-secretase subunit APH-1A n=1 Tax=Paragonimus westermani TaxID=34504 RepID=A0A5J4P150_9TREM|nr:gamma-secretase subunit APH-1A [Paragonimus westermani]
MTRVGGVGCALIGFGPSTILFFLTTVVSPLKLIVLTGSGFFWILSVLLTSLVWIVLNLLTSHIAWSLLAAVLSQELMRFVFYKLIMYAGVFCFQTLYVEAYFFIVHARLSS